MYIPANKIVGDIAVLFSLVVNEHSKVFFVRENANLCNRVTGHIYSKDYFIRQTDIRNGTELVLF